MRVPASSPTSPVTITPCQYTRAQELALFQEVRQGSSVAKDKLAESQMPAAKRLVSERFPRLSADDRQEAESIAFEAVSRAIDRFDPTRGYRLFTLAHVAINRSLTRFKPNRRHAHIRDEADLVQGVRGLPPEQTSEIHAAIKALPRAQRSVVSCIAIERMTQQQTAKKLRLSLGKVRRLYADAKAALQVALKDYG